MHDRYTGLPLGSALTSEARTPVSGALLLVESDEMQAEAIKSALGAALPAFAVTHCASAAAARVRLAGGSFAAVFAAPRLTDGRGLDLAGSPNDLGGAPPLFVLDRAGDAATEREVRASGAAVYLTPGDLRPDRLRQLLGPMGDGAAGEPPAPPGAADRGGEAHAILDALRAEVGGVVHAANNPLTVIAGNAQLLLELARTSELDPTFARPIEDIEEAGRQLADALARLSEVRQRLADTLGTPDRIG
jgi:signal transduction histidine kinase